MNTISTDRKLYLWARTINSLMHMRFAQCAQFILAIKSFPGLVTHDEMLQKRGRQFFRFVGVQTTKSLRCIVDTSHQLCGDGPSMEIGITRFQRKKAYISSSHIFEKFLGARRRGGVGSCTMGSKTQSVDP